MLLRKYFSKLFWKFEESTRWLPTFHFERRKDVPRRDWLHYSKGMGVRKSKDIIVAEIKIKPTLKDIYQTKRYAEILNASYALLISPNKLSPERRRYLMKRKEEITRFLPNKQILIGQFRQEMLEYVIQIDKELYYSLPEPFKE